MHLFQFRWIPLIATGLLMAIFLRLGWWQWTKAIEVEHQVELREARSARGPLLLGTQPVDANEVNGSLVLVRGHFDAAQQFFLDNQQHLGQPGVHVLTPLIIENSNVRVLVNRGWLGWGASRAVLPQAPVPQGPVEIQGRAMVPSSKAPAFVSEPLDDAGSLRTRIRLEAIQATSNHPVQPIVILMASDTSSQDGLIQAWPEPENKAAMHKGYAAQWFLMSVVLLAFFVRTAYRKAND